MRKPIPPFLPFLATWSALTFSPRCPAPRRRTALPRPFAAINFAILFDDVTARVRRPGECGELAGASSWRRRAPLPPPPSPPNRAHRLWFLKAPQQPSSIEHPTAPPLFLAVCCSTRAQLSHLVIVFTCVTQGRKTPFPSSRIPLRALSHTTRRTPVDNADASSTGPLTNPPHPPHVDSQRIPPAPGLRCSQIAPRARARPGAPRVAALGVVLESRRTPRLNTVGRRGDRSRHGRYQGRARGSRARRIARAPGGARRGRRARTQARRARRGAQARRTPGASQPAKRTRKRRGSASMHNPRSAIDRNEADAGPSHPAVTPSRDLSTRTARAPLAPPPHPPSAHPLHSLPSTPPGLRSRMA